MTSFKIIMWVVLITLLVLIGPLVTIWALNTLFPVLAIPYTFDTWASVVVIQAVLRSNLSTSK
jgi:hypothetical protein